jgi:hypothetical protein
MDYTPAYQIFNGLSTRPKAGVCLVDRDGMFDRLNPFSPAKTINYYIG